MSTDPATLTASKAFSEFNERMLKNKSAWEAVQIIALIWPNGIRIVPDPIPEPGPEVTFVTFARPGSLVEVYRRRLAEELGASAFPWVDTKGNSCEWGFIIEGHNAWTLTEYVAKGGAK